MMIIAGNTSNNTGGPIEFGAEENTRASIFDNLRSKEVFGTSGPRIKPRFFGGCNYDKSLCADPQLLTRAYADGVSMGNNLPSPQGAAPVFIATAVSDPGTTTLPGTPLQRLQVIKGW